MEQDSSTEAARVTLALFADAGVPLTTTEVAERLDLGRRATYGRLERLADRGRLETKKVGANARVWWRPDPAPGPSPDWPAAAESLVGDVLDDVEVGIFVLDDDYEVAWINGATERYFGIDREEVIGRDKRRLIDERVAPAVEDSGGFAETVLATYDENTYTERFECHVTPGEGRQERWLEHRSRPIESGAYAGGRVELYYDVTDRKRSELARLRDRTQFESMVEAVEEYAIFMLDPDGYVRTWNPGAERIKGYEADEIVGEHFSTFYTAEDREAGVPAGNLEAARADGSIQEEGWRVRSDGTRFWANVTITAVYEDGELQGYAKVTRDMTERREYEQRLREEKAFTESVLDSQRDIVYAFGEDGTILRWNDSLREATGYGDDQIEGMTPEDFVADDAADEFAAALDRVFERGETTTVELPLVTADGERIPYEFTGGPITDQGEVVGVTGVGRDVSDRKARERRLERQRDDLEAELDDVFDRIDDAVLGIDGEWRFTYLNDRAEELLGRDEAELVGGKVWDALPESVERSFREHYERAMETQEPVSFEEFSDAAAAWLEVTAYPSETGLSVYFRDVTERLQRERELERYETIVETIWDGVYALDDEESFVMANDAFLEMTGYERAELLGRPGKVVHNEDVNEAASDLAESVLAGEREYAAVEFDLVTADGDTVPVESRFGPYRYDEDHYGRCGVVRDVTERVERERELEESRRRYRTLVENFPNGVVALVDRDLRYVTVGGTVEGDTEVSNDDLEGASPREGLPPALADAVAPHYEAALEGETVRSESTIDGRTYQFHFLPVRDDDGEVFAALGMSQDVTERKEREQALRDRMRQQDVVADLGQRALEDRDLDGLMTDATELVADTLGTDYCKVLDLDREADDLLLRQGVGWDDGIVGTATVSAVEDDSQAAYTLASSEPVRVGDLATETRFSGPDLLTDHDVRSGISVVVGSCDDPWGILGTHDTEPTSFSEEDVNFVQAVANILATAIERKEAELELERRREQLTALNNVNEVVQGITSAIVEQSTREEIEEIVCEHLAASDSYEFAWVCEVDPATRAVVPRVEAGVEGYLDAISLSADPDEQSGQGPTGTAIRSHETQVANAFEDPEFEPWREHAREYGFQSSAAIPIVHEGTLYGVLGVYADRHRAFDGEERTVVGLLGEVVGHAIAAAERKQALMSDEVVELEFRIEDAFGSLDTAVDPEGRITLDHVIPLEDREFLVYGTATEDAVDALHALVDATPAWEEVTVRSEGDPVGFELRMTDPPVLSTVASHGGYVDETVIEDGDVRMTAHLAPSVDVRLVIDAVEEAYPGAEMLRRQQVTRDPDDARNVQRHLLADLTDRQRTALETAYHAGFFEWPRTANGEDVAETLGVSAPTFHQHLRKGQRKVFESVFAPGA